MQDMQERNDSPMSEGTEFPASTGSDPRFPNTDAAETSDGFILTSLSHVSQYSRHQRNIHASCNHYGIRIGKSKSVTLAKLILHIVGLGRDRLGRTKWEFLSARLSRMCQYTRGESVEAINIRGLNDYPKAWIPCLSYSEALRQCIKRLADENGVVIPEGSQDLRGIEPARMPTFHLHNCFSHLISERRDKLNRFIYIEKALSCFGVYPNSTLFQQIGTFLASILTPTLLSHKSARWGGIRLLNALGMGFQLGRNKKGKLTRHALLQPWGIEIGPPFDVDFLVSIWLGHVIGSALVEGQRRGAGDPEFLPPTPVSSRKPPRQEDLGPDRSAVTPEKPKHIEKDPTRDSIPTEQMMTPSLEPSRQGRARSDRWSLSPSWPSTTSHQASKLDLFTSDQESAVALMRARARRQGRLDERTEGGEAQSHRNDNAHDRRDRVRKARPVRRVSIYTGIQDVSPGGHEGQRRHHLDDQGRGGDEEPAETEAQAAPAAQHGVEPSASMDRQTDEGGPTGPGEGSPERRSPRTASDDNDADGSRTTVQVPTPSKTPGKRGASPARQAGGQEHKKVRLSLTATYVNWGKGGIASRPTACPDAISEGGIPLRAWPLHHVYPPGRVKQHRNQTTALPPEISVEQNKKENKKDDSDHSALDDSSTHRFSDGKLPGKRLAAQSDMGGRLGSGKKTRLSPSVESHQGGATTAVPSESGTSVRQGRSYLTAAWGVLRGLWGRKTRRPNESAPSLHSTMAAPSVDEPHQHPSFATPGQ